MHNAILIFEEIPIATNIFILSNLSDEDYARLVACHRKYVNADESEDLEWLLNQIFGEYRDGVQVKPPVWQSTSLNEPLNVTAGTIVLSGFIL
jgi:hypothetical protein